MEILKKIYPIMLAAFLTGCSEEVVLEINPKPVLCVNSLVRAGEPIEVDVTHSWLYTDEEGADDHYVGDARISIYANGEQVRDNYRPHEGDSIRIVAESAAYGSAEAKVEVPAGVPIASLKWDAKITRVSETAEYHYVRRVYYINLQGSLIINDPAIPVNYYQFSYRAFPWGVEADGHPIDRLNPGTFHYEAEPIFSEHIYGIDASSDPYGFSFFSDRQFSGKSYTLNLLFRDMTLTIDDRDFSDEMLDCGLVVTLNTVSPSLYKWNCYKWHVRNSTIGDLGEFGLADPLWGYSNVSTGAGVVAALSSRSDTIRLKDFLLESIRP